MSSELFGIRTAQVPHAHPHELSASQYERLLHDKNLDRLKAIKRVLKFIRRLQVRTDVSIVLIT